MPSRRTSVAAREASKPFTAAPSRSDDAGRCATPDTSKDEPSAVVIARFAVTSSSPCSTSVRSLSALGSTFSVTSVITDRVPHDPAKSLQRS